jgi:benzodiazapine receptor
MLLNHSFERGGDPLNRIDFLRLAACILICQAAGALGSVFTVKSLDVWYASLVKPSFNPPGWVFGPVWTALYILMGIAAWLVWRSGSLAEPPVRNALLLFLVQLSLNALWSFLFFGLRSPLLALADILALLAAILATIAAFRPISPMAARLMVPYLAWVSFATVLNAAIWKLNP